MEKISYAVIGSGNHALNVFIPALSESYNSHLGCISKSKALDSWLSIGTTVSACLKQSEILDVEDILSNDSIEAVYISTPNSYHGDLVSKALAAGKHVLCEKPLSYLEKDIELLEQSRQSNVILCTGFMYRLHPQYQILKELLEGEEILEISAGFAYQIDSVNYNIRIDPEKGGGVILDVGCYLLDIIRYILEPESIEYSINKICFSGTRDSEVELSGVAFSTRGQTNISLFASQQSDRKQYLEIKTKTKVISLHSPFLVPRNKKVYISVNNLGGKTETIYLPPFNQVLAQINLFSESIKKGHLFSPLTDGMVNAQDLSCLYSDIHSGR